MKTKKLIALLPAFFVTGILMASCYASWNTAYNNATNEYNADMEYCANEVSARCSREAGLSYGQSLDAAAQAYYDCLK